MEKDTPILKERELSPRFIGPYENLERIGSAAYVSNSALGLLYGHGILTIYENLLL